MTLNRLTTRELADIFTHARTLRGRETAIRIRRALSTYVPHIFDREQGGKHTTRFARTLRGRHSKQPLYLKKCDIITEYIGSDPGRRDKLCRARTLRGRIKFSVLPTTQPARPPPNCHSIRIGRAPKCSLDRFLCKLPVFTVGERQLIQNLP